MLSITIRLADACVAPLIELSLIKEHMCLRVDSCLALSGIVHAITRKVLTVPWKVSVGRHENEVYKDLLVL